LNNRQNMNTMVRCSTWSRLLDLELGLPGRIEVREVWVLESILATDALVRLVSKELSEEVNAVGVEAGDDAGHVLGGPRWESRLPVRKLGDIRPDSLGWGSTDAEDAVELVDLGVTWEEWLLGDELSENATDGPHVNADRVMLASEEDFRGTVPEGNNLQEKSQLRRNPRQCARVMAVKLKDELPRE